MPRLSAEPIVLAAAHEQVLVRLVRAHTTPRKVAVRTWMTLLTAAGIGVGETARHWLHCWRNSAKATQVAQRLLTSRALAHRRHSRPNRSARLSHWRASNRRNRAIRR
jgi:hypothetical protein